MWHSPLMEALMELDFVAVDKNRNGYVSLQELQAYFHEHPPREVCT